MDSWYRIQDGIIASRGKPIEMVVDRNHEFYSCVVNPIIKTDRNTGAGRPFIGIGATVKKLDGLTRKVEYGPAEAFAKGISDSMRMAKLVLVSAYKLLNGTISTENISGPIAIAKGAQESAQFGLTIFISFLAAISVNLGILNLIPIPVLDGGQLVFLAYEAVMGREPNLRVQAVLTSVGAALLIALTVFAVYNDIKGL